MENSETNINANVICCSENKSKKLSVLIERLREKQFKITAPRLSALKMLVAQSKPVSIKEVYKYAKSDGCDLATIYRLFNVLEELKLIQRVDFGEGLARFEIVLHDSEHHHHIVCTKCSAVMKIEECVVKDLHAAIESRSGFKSVTHRLEFFGICPRCQKNET
ncbi:MAG: transcriptional repressor [Verrucomicrobiae bacterium]|nr:transcriptional repressor [Verrucomicrobiae bacterium]